MLDQVEIKNLIADAVDARELPALSTRVFKEIRKGYSYPGSAPVPDWTCITVHISFAEGDVEAKEMLLLRTLERHTLYGLPGRGELMGKYHERITGKIIDLLGGDSKNRWARLPSGEQLDVHVFSDHTTLSDTMGEFLDRALKSARTWAPVEHLAANAPSFKELIDLGLIFASSPRQIKNKTHVYYDPKTDSYLRFYRSERSCVPHITRIRS